MPIIAEKEHEVKYIDQSGLCTFERCPARYFFSRILGLKDPRDNMMAADYGTCIHAAMPFCHAGNLPAAMQAFTDDWNRFGYGEGTPERNVGRALSTLQVAVSTRSGPARPYTPVTFENIPVPLGAERFSKNEVPFAIDIGTDLPAIGRIDAIVEWHQDNNTRWPLDYKTSSEVSARWFAGFNFHPQACLYTIAASHVLGIDAKGLIIEAIRVSPKNDEISFKPIFISNHQVSEFIEWAKWKVFELLNMNKSGVWQKKPTGCTSYACYYAASRYCEYKMLCDATDYRTMMSYYTQSEPFHPFKVA